MREGVLFVIVTNDPEQALGSILACAKTNAPKFARVVSDAAEILALPDGTKCYPGHWFPGPGADELQMLFRERRLRGGIHILDAAELDKVSAWRARHVAAMDRALEIASPPSADAPAEMAAPPPAAPMLSQEWR